MASSSKSERFSMNTSLKNARIFDDDSWDAETAGFIVKTETKEESTGSESKDGIGEETSCFNVKVKIEPGTFCNENAVSPFKTNVTPNIKKEPDECSFLYKSTQTGNKQDNNLVSFSHFNHRNAKKNEDSTEGFEESYLDEIDPKIKETIVGTPNKMGTSRDLCTDDSNPSPFNKELFRKFSLKQNDNSPDLKEKRPYLEPKREGATRNLSFPKEEYRVTRRTSPRKRNTAEMEQSNEKVSVKKRLGTELDSDIPQKKQRKQVEPENDPVVLARRQKQIDFGKNTMGYDNYLNQVPRDQRKKDDPQTPNKFVKYSRRAFDGLIKQWRLKLHKYDPS